LLTAGDAQHRMMSFKSGELDVYVYVVTKTAKLNLLYLEVLITHRFGTFDLCRIQKLQYQYTVTGQEDTLAL
jgi:hypothetical protein